MLLVGLTGGIGSGKSTVAHALARRGAHVLDADALAREVVAPGTPGLAAVRERFGAGVVGPGGSLDRARLASLVFEDPTARQALQDITHPRIAALTAERLAALPPDDWAVHDVPLLVELGYAPRYHLVVVVAADPGVRVERLVAARGMTREDAQARVRAQAREDERRAVADVWLDNSGPPGDVERAVDVLVDDRLEPYRTRMREGRPVGESEQVAPSPGEHVEGRARRVRARLEHVLDRAGKSRTCELRTDEDGWTRGEIAMEGAGTGDPRLRRVLGEAGFPPAGDGRLGSADPGRPVSVRVRAGSGPR